MFSFKNFVQGWTNYVFTDPVLERLAKKRAEVCSGCKESVKSKYLDWFGDEIKEVEGLICKACKGCPLSAKIRARDSNCDLNKWDVINK